MNHTISMNRLDILDEGNRKNADELEETKFYFKNKEFALFLNIKKTIKIENFGTVHKRGRRNKK